MASSKDTFEAGAFLANTFACGTFRGVGVDVAEAQPLGIEHTLPVNRMHYTLPENRLHGTLPTNRLHYTIPAEE